MTRTSRTFMPLLIKLMRIFTALICFSLASTSFATSRPVVCDKPSGADIDNSLIRLLGFHCGNPMDSRDCRARVLAPSEADGRKFQFFEFILVEGEEKKITAAAPLEWYLSDSGEFVETNFSATERLARLVRIRAVYEARVYGPGIACVLASSMDFDKVVDKWNKANLVE